MFLWVLSKRGVVTSFYEAVRKKIVVAKSCAQFLR